MRSSHGLRCIAFLLWSATGCEGQKSSTSVPTSSPIIGSTTNRTNSFLEDAPNTPSTNDTIGAEYKLGDWKKCEDWQKLAIRDAFSEMIEMIGREYIASDDPPSSRKYRYVDWKSAIAIDYFGSAATLDSNTREVILGKLYPTFRCLVSSHQRSFYSSCPLHVIRSNFSKTICHGY